MPEQTPAPGCTTCTLPPDALAERVAAWRQVTGEALDHDRAAGRLVSTYPPSAGIARRLAELVAAEGECCPVLEFDLREEPDRVRLEMRYPPEFAGMVETILDG